MHKRLLPFFFLITFFITGATAQTVEKTGWLVLGNSTKLSSHFSTFLDIQFRGADRLEYVHNFIFRPGLTYHINKSYSLSAGYMYAPVFNKINGDIITFDENRIWQQFQISQRISRLHLTHRFRYEQRFIEQTAGTIFSQRGRYMFKSVLPLTKDTEFKKGTYLSVADELFFTLSNKEKLSQHFFDQNRAYFGAGYRVNSNVDLELNYLWRIIQGPTASRNADVLQLGVSTRF